MEIIKDFVPYKMGKVDKFDVEEFINKELRDVMNIMGEYRLPYLHCAQVGIDKNIAIMNRNDKWFFLCNPRFTPARKSKPKTIQEASFSHIIQEPPKILTTVFKTERHMIVRGMYETYTEGGQLVPDSDKFEYADAVIIQALSDISAGKSITRFPMYIVEDTDENTK